MKELIPFTKDTDVNAYPGAELWNPEFNQTVLIKLQDINYLPPKLEEFGELDHPTSNLIKIGKMTKYAYFGNLSPIYGGFVNGAFSVWDGLHRLMLLYTLRGPEGYVCARNSNCGEITKVKEGKDNPAIRIERAIKALCQGKYDLGAMVKYNIQRIDKVHDNCTYQPKEGIASIMNMYRKHIAKGNQKLLDEVKHFAESKNAQRRIYGMNEENPIQMYNKDKQN